MPTPFQLHVLNWKDCTRCYLHEYREHVVLARGSIPCDILFCGEAPGISEDTLAEPFRGPAGLLLDEIISRAIPDKYYVAITNLIACIPADGENKKLSKPPIEAVRACAPRLQDFIENLAKPKLIVYVGNEARDWLDPKRKFNVSTPTIASKPSIHITHPAAILRAKQALKSFAIQKAIVTVSTAVQEYLD